MKELILPLVAFLCLSMNVVAQNGTGACKVYGFTLELVSAETSKDDEGKRDITLNLTWEIELNPGRSAVTYFHIWQDNAYTLIDYSKTSNPPKAADLVRTLGTIAIENPATTPKIINSYAPDAKYTNLIGMGNKIERKALSNGNEQFTITGLVIPGVSATANGKYNFIGDIWSSQSGNNINCFAKGRTFVVNEVANRSLFNCTDGGKLRVSIVSTQASATGTYQLYSDHTNPGTFDASGDTRILSEQPFTTPGTATLGGDYPYAFIATSELSIPSEYSGKRMYLVVTPASQSSQVFSIDNSCSPLPVTFGTFSAVRKGTAVAVKWQTTYELNVSHFTVQRMTNGNWTTVSVVPASNLANGSSYELTDVNTHTGLSQYRIVSVDNDGRQKLSEVRSVRGEASGAKLTVYPNPTTTGRISLVFDNNGIRDISVLDMSGRIVKQLQGQKSNQVSLEIMQDGMYCVQIADRATGELTVEKVIVKKR